MAWLKPQCYFKRNSPNCFVSIKQNISILWTSTMEWSRQSVVYEKNVYSLCHERTAYILWKCHCLVQYHVHGGPKK